MTSQQTSARPRRQFGWRFTLGSLLVLIAGLSVGLATTRLPMVRWFDSVLAAFVAWFAIGCWGRSIYVWRTPKQVDSATSPMVAAFSTAAMFFAPIAVGLGAGLLIARETAPGAFRFDDYHFSQAFEFLCLGLILVPLIAVLDLNPRPRPASGSKLWLIALDCAAMIAGAALTVALVGNMLLASVLVHVAINGVRSAQRHRPEGDQFSSEVYDPSSVAVFAFQALAAAAAWCLSVWLLRAFARCPSSGQQTWRIGAGLTACLTAVAALLVTGISLAQRQVSPIVADFVLGTKPPILWWLAAPFLMVAAAFVASRLMRHSTATSTQDDEARNNANARPLDQWLVILLLPLVWWVADRWGALRGLSETIWERIEGKSSWEDFFWSLGETVVFEAPTFLVLGYFLTWLQIAWQRCRRYDDVDGGLQTVAPSRLIAVWLASLAILAMAGPVWGWLCFVLWTWPGQFPGESWLLQPN